MSPEAVQAVLIDLQRRATRVATRGDGRETWRFRVDGAAPEYDLHFYPDDDTTLRKYVGGADAAREFTQLQALQKLAIPATRVIANLKGYRLGDRKGDACILVHDPAAVPLDAVLREFAAMRIRERLAVTAGLFERLESLHRERLCPRPLVVHSFARRRDITLLADGGVRLGGIVDADRLHELDASTRHITTAADRLRTWRHFTVEPPPRGDRAIARAGKSLANDALLGTDSFGTLEHEGVLGDWHGRFLRRVPITLPWSVANKIEFERGDWERALPTILDDAQGDAVKDDAAASVKLRTITVAGRSLDVVIKRPGFKPGLRGGLQSFRRTRAMRSWIKTWRMLATGFACEVPLIVLERKRGPRVLEQLLVVERVPGETLAKADLGALAPRERSRLLYASGRTLRRIESIGATHCDAKATNWIVWTDAAGHTRPIMIDLDGVRFYRWRGMGHERLARAMRAHPQITAADLEELTRGYRGPR